MYSKTEGVMNLNIKQFLIEVYKYLPKHDDVKVSLEDTAIKFRFGESNCFEVRAPGGICFTPDTKRDDMFEILHDEIDEAVQTVKEYLNLMEESPPLKARDFNMDYKKLAEYNGVVLGGTEHSDGSFEFTTWSYADKSLYHGHYYEDYNKAKEDFAVRSGLVPKQLVFNTEELIEIYRSTVDTLAGEYEISEAQEKILDTIGEKIKDFVTCFDQKLSESVERNAKPFQEEQSM